MVSFDDGAIRREQELLEGSISRASLTHSAAETMRRSVEWFRGQQAAEGSWCGELEGDSILQSEYLLLLAWLGQTHTRTAQRCAAQLLRQQMPTGGWSMYPGGKLEISASVKAYFALKLTGHDPQSDAMTRAREAILAHGGADAVNSFTRFYLALLGQISYEHCPAVPPEMVLLPDWFPFNIYRMSAWSRTIFVPLSIVWAHRPVREVPAEQGISDLFLQPPEKWPALKSPGREESLQARTWERFFRGVDSSLKFLERHSVRPLRKKALRASTEWMTERFSGSDGLGAIFPPIIWSIIALRCQGFADDSAEVQYCHEQLEGLMIEQAETIRLQPCKSPVWDTAIAVRALAAASVPESDPATQRATEWLLDKEVTRKGDWSHVVDIEPSGWYFEYNNEYYPDIDDTIMVLMALRDQSQDHWTVSATRTASSESGWRLGRSRRSIAKTSLSFVGQNRSGSLAELRRGLLRIDRLSAAAQRGINWVLAMQNRDGGWGAFDKDNDYRFLCYVPFADHNAMIDPSTPDITGRVLEMLGKFGFSRSDIAVQRAIDYVRQTQEADGSWYGRWGVNYIYGTWQVLAGLAQIGIAENDPMMTRGADWLLRHQQASGGWGESADSYDQPQLRGQGIATASQTAWALLGLMAAGMHRHSAVSRGIRWLIDHQSADGTWAETEFTGTGFPRVFYLRYHLYPQYFPLLAIGQWQRAIRESS